MDTGKCQEEAGKTEDVYWNEQAYHTRAHMASKDHDDDYLDGHGEWPKTDRGGDLRRVAQAGGGQEDAVLGCVPESGGRWTPSKTKSVLD